MSNFKDFIENPVLNDLYYDRMEKLSHDFIKTSKKYQELVEASEKKLKTILNYVPGELYKELEKEIEDYLFENVMALSELWNSNYYKLGFIDGMKTNKELKELMEVIENGKSNE